MTDAVATIGRDFQQHFFRAQIEQTIFQREARKAIEHLIGSAVVKIESLIFGKVRIKRDSQQSILARPRAIFVFLLECGHGNLSNHKHRARGRHHAQHTTFALDDKYITVRR